jgi:hypothetical protein
MFISCSFKSFVEEARLATVRVMCRTRRAIQNSRGIECLKNEQEKRCWKKRRRREPLMPRTHTESGLLHELELGDERDVLGKCRLTTRKWVIPADPELVARDHGNK